MKRIAAVEPQPPWGMWGAIGAMIASFMAIIAGATVAAILAETPTQSTLLLGWSIGAAIVIGFVWVSRRAPKYWSILWNGDPKTESSATQNIFWYLFIGVGLAILIDLVGRAVLGQIAPDPELLDLFFYFRAYQQPIAVGSWILVILFMVVLQPLAEGLVFQGLLLPSLRATLSPRVGFVLTIVAYTMFHFIGYPPPSTANNTVLIWLGVAEPLISGLIFTAVRVYTGSTRAAILTHVAFGLFAVIKLLTLVSG
jgi:membrane protease YdiL (CAAX protease family)